MAKKSRRARSAAPSRSPDMKPAAAVQPLRVSRPIRSPVAEAAKQVDFSKEYHYVLEDLRRIAVIAGALLVVLVALALIIG